MDFGRGYLRGEYMKDRVPTYPGRVKLTPVVGQTNIYDLEMADQPTENGTALNKANLLTDATAALLAAIAGITPQTPDEALAALAGAVGSALHAEVITYVGTGTYGSQANATVLNFTHEPKLFIITQINNGGPPKIVNYTRNQGVYNWEALKNAWENRGTAAYGATSYSTYESYYYEIRYLMDGNTIKMFSMTSDTYQYNNQSTYVVVALY